MSVAVRLSAGIAVLMLLLTACSGDDDTPTQTGATGDSFEIALLDTMRFEPSSITVKPGEKVVVRLTNKGTIPHNFSIQGLDVSQDVAPGKTETVTFTAPSSPGEHKIFCNVPGHEAAGMVGALVVQE